MSANVLVIEDDPQGLESLEKILKLEGHTVVTARNGREGLAQIHARGFDVVLSDIRMPELSGLDLVRALKSVGKDKELPVILMTAFGNVEDAVWAMKHGVVDFLTKPFKRSTVVTAVRSALDRKQALSAGQASPVTSREREREREREFGSALSLLMGASQPMRELRALIRQVGPTRTTILIEGESGSGKELVAQAIHTLGAKPHAPWIVLNCAALPESLVEAELFGFEKGAFTGAVHSRAGLFEAADGGTLFLDEIGELPLSTQAKLLRVLQEGEVRRIGAQESRKVDVRVITATHRNLKEMAALGLFREDLRFRLDVISVKAPALRERLEDLPELAQHFLSEHAHRHGKLGLTFAGETLALLTHHAWPGNVRELSNVIERAVVLAPGPELRPDDLPAHLRDQDLQARFNKELSGGRIEVPIGTPLREVENLLIEKTLALTSGDKAMTAKLLGVNSRTIYRWLESKDG